MEELLNKLIEKGWKPREKDYTEVCVYDWIVRFERRFWADCIETFRTLTSKESWLWQFVCENEMQNMIEEHREGYCSNEDYWYRLIESALCDEDKLEQFLLDNIKIDE